MDPTTAGELVGQCLRELGATRAFGDPLPGLGHVPVDDPWLASLLADADGRCGRGPGVALEGRNLRVSTRPGASAEPVPLQDPSELAVHLAAWRLGPPAAVAEFVLDFDLAARPGTDVPRYEVHPEMYTLSPALAEATTVVLAGPGVVRRNQVAGLRELAARARCGVVNTWGAKGVFAWDSPYHMGTAGLQERDFDLAGLGEAELVIATGIDEDESPRERWAGSQVLEVEPESLVSLAFSWEPPEREPQRPPLYVRLSEALAEHYRSEEVPLCPARAAADLSSVRPDGGLVAADPGPAGLWVARAFPTTEAGSVVVPATVAPGFAAAAAFVSALDGRPSVAVTTAPADEATITVIGHAEARGLPLVLEEWGADAALATPGDRVEALRAALEAGGTHVLPVPVDFSHTKVLVEVAGPVVAWGASGGGQPDLDA